MTEHDNISNSLKEFLDLFEIKIEIPENRERSAAEVHGNYTEIVNQTQAKLDEYNQKGEEILKNTGMTREQLEAYASDPNNFTPEQWEGLKKLKAATEEIRKRTYRIAGGENLKKTIDKERKKQHHRFGKKKNWISL
jgi:hypothetical protein